MINYEDWLEAMPALLRDVALREEVIDDLEDDGPRLVAAGAAQRTLSADDAECLVEAASEAFYRRSKRVVTLDWDSCSPMGGCGASWVDGYAGVYCFGSSDWEAQGPFDSVDGALCASSSFEMATYDASLQSDTLSEARLLSIGWSICPYDGTIYVNGAAYRRGEDELVPADDDELDE